MIAKGIFLFFNVLFLWLKTRFIKKNNAKVFLIFQNPNIGGGTTFFYNITEFFLGKNLSISLLVKSAELNDEIKEYCCNNDIEIITYIDEISDNFSLSFFNKDFIKFSYNYLKQIYFLLQHYQKILPSFTFVFQGWPFMWFKSLYLPGKIYYSQHVMPLSPLDKGNELFLKIALLRRACFFITVSNFSLNKMKKYWIGNYKKTAVVYNYYKTTKKSLKLPISKSANITVLALARVEEGKNPMLWIKLAKIIVKKRVNVRFIWAGDGGLLDEAKEKTAIESRISFIGFKKNVELLYENADIYFVPSKREAHGIAEVGAMANGLPVIATNNGGTTESILHKKNGFIVDMNDEAKILYYLLRLIDSSSLRKNMGVNGYIRWKQIFTKEIWEEKMIELLELS